MKLSHGHMKSMYAGYLSSVLWFCLGRGGGGGGGQKLNREPQL